MLLKNRVILLTGGTEGIGRRCADAYAAEGACVAIASLGDVEGTVRGLGEGHLGVPCDVSCAEQVEAAIAATLERYGRIDAIHNNAGIPGPSKPLHETEPAEWDAVTAVNLKSIYLTTRYGFAAL